MDPFYIFILCVGLLLVIAMMAAHYFERRWPQIVKMREEERRRYRIDWYKTHGDFQELLGTFLEIADNRHGLPSINLSYYGDEFRLAIMHNGVEYTARGADPWLAAENMISNFEGISKPIRAVLDKQKREHEGEYADE